MATYTNITREEMTNYLPESRGWTTGFQGRVGELVFSYKIPSRPDLTIKVWSSITRDGSARRSGTDAIRVCAVRTDLVTGNTFGWIKSTRVHRVAGWRDNLTTRIMTVIGEARSRPVGRPSPSASPSASVANSRFREARTDEERASEAALRLYEGANSFLNSLKGALSTYGRLSDRQWAALVRALPGVQNTPEAAPEPTEPFGRAPDELTEVAPGSSCPF